MIEHDNCTFSKLEILDHNIGYVKFGAFPDPEIYEDPRWSPP